jgi:hypothetical protein
MPFRTFRNAGLFLLPFCLSPGLRAGEWELGAAIAFGRESNGNISANGNFPTMPYTIVQNSLRGAWNQGGLQVGYEVIHRGPWGVWIQAQYSEGLSHPGIYHSGENYATGSTVTEAFNGTATYKSRFFGIGVTRKFSLVEVGLSLGPRSHDLSVEGSRQNNVNGVFTYDHYTVSHAYRDTFLVLGFAASQPHDGFKSLQKISYGIGFGSTVPAVNPGPSDWRMSEAYLAQFRPNQEVRITLGVRL